MPPIPQWPRDPDAPIPPEFHGLIFDCDGTLVDTMPLHYLAWRKSLAQVGLLFPEDRFYSFAGAPTVTIIQTLAREQKKNVNAQAVADLKEQFYVESLSTLEPIHSVIAIAHREKAAGRKIAVASGGWRRVVKESLTVVGIEDIFDAIVGADDVVHGKPAPDVFLKAAELIGIAPRHCLVYEDGDLGIQAAKNAGMAVIDVHALVSSTTAK